MKRFVNGQEIELAEDAATVVHSQDRLMVRTATGSSSAVAIRSGESVLISYRGHTYKVDRRAPRKAAAAGEHTGEFRAAMPGAIVHVLVAEGESVVKGQKLVVLEAMKMQQPSIAPFDGVVVRVGVQKGDQVAEGAVLVEIRAEAK